MLKLLLITKCNQNRDNERGLAKKKKVLLDLKMIAVKDIAEGLPPLLHPPPPKREKKSSTCKTFSGIYEHEV